MSTVIEDVAARKVFNSRGQETLEVDITTATSFGTASAPAGASKGEEEVVSYPNGEVDEAIKKVEELVGPELIGMDAGDQEEIDSFLHEIDGTKNFRNIGGNTAYAFSMAVAEAAANSYGVPLFQRLAGYFACELPYPLGNVLGGGKHALGKVPDIQEFLVLPVGATTFFEAAKANVLFHRKVGLLLKSKALSFAGGRGDEGAWAANISNEKALEIMSKVCKEVHGEIGFECGIGVDMAASTLWKPKEKRYIYSNNKARRDSGEQLEFVLSLIENHDLIYVEDPFHERDFESFAELVRKAEGRLICGDDLFVTNQKRLKHGMAVGAANSIIIKVNQVGTLTDAWQTTKTAQNAGYIPVMSHRSGDTTDPHLAHLAMAFHCPIIKTGVVGGARIAKINELIYIEEMLGDRGRMCTLRLRGKNFV
ncbi:MAG: phosphopyruvate hydratase [Thermoproteota archaeon]|nr:phosphopyruvate hydratase [Thermoproteota archaeon]